MLLDQEEFRRYFKVQVNQDQNRWHTVLDFLSGNNYYVQEILYELQMLNQELMFVRNNFDIQSSKAEQFFRSLSQIIARHNSAEPGYDQVDMLGSFLWEIFSGWSVGRGYRETNLIEEMIEQI